MVAVVAFTLGVVADRALAPGVVHAISRFSPTRLQAHHKHTQDELESFFPDLKKETLGQSSEAIIRQKLPRAQEILRSGEKKSKSAQGILLVATLLASVSSGLFISEVEGVRENEVGGPAQLSAQLIS